MARIDINWLRELEAKRSSEAKSLKFELKQLAAEHAEVEARLKHIEGRLNDLRDGWNRGGLVSRAVHSHTQAQKVALLLGLPAVRIRGGSFAAFIKATPKAVYVSKIGDPDREIQVPDVKRSQWADSIHPADLELIRSGQVDQLPKGIDVFDVEDLPWGMKPKAEDAA